MKRNYIIFSITIFIIVIIAGIAWGYNSYKENAMIITGESNAEFLNAPIEEKDLIDDIDAKDVKKLNNIIEDEREDLKYDEAINIEFKGKKVVITGVQPLKNIDQIKGYYPSINIPTSLNGYNFEKALIFENSIRNYYISDEKIVSQEELGRVYKRELKANNVKYINLKYSKNNKSMVLNIYVGENTYDKEKLKDKYNIHIVEENGIKYSILKEKKDNTMKGIYFELDVNKENYAININMVQGTDNEGMSEKEIRELLKAMDMINFIDKLNIGEGSNKK